jgi:hypothetical protein
MRSDDLAAARQAYLAARDPIMPRLYGHDLNRAALAARAGSLSQFAGVRLMTLGDGVERGVRLLEFRTGTGLRFTVLVDRAMDIADFEHNGRAVGWHSPTGFRHPGLHEPDSENGMSWLRSFSGFQVTCGLDHTLGPGEFDATHYNYPHRKTVKQSLHGRVGMIPARLTGYGERWEGDRCFLWAEGTVTQASVFGENLVMTRRIEAEVGCNHIRLSDKVENAGFLTTPHMFFYHFNIGHPVLEAGSRYLAPIKDVVWAGHAGEHYRTQGVGYRSAPPPLQRFSEQVWQHETAADETGIVSVALINDRLAFGIEIATRKAQLPCLYQWQNFQAGSYCLGIEPSTHHVLGNQAARDRGEMIWLEAGEARHYETDIVVLDGADDIADTEQRIAAIAKQPDEDYPEPSGQFCPLMGRTKSR